MDKILLFIPMYNCQNQIPRVIEKVRKSEIYDKLTQIIIIDNHSKDQSLKVAQKAIEDCHVTKANIMQNIENVGLGGSHKTAFSYALANGFDYIIVLHGDDQGDITDLAPSIASNEYKKHDAILGSRFMRNSRINGYSKFRVFGNRIYNYIISGICLKRITDLGAGLNMYNVSSLREQFYLRFPDNLTFNVFMLYAHTSYKHKISFVPISWSEEDQVSNVKLFSQTYQMSRSMVKYLFMRQEYLAREHRSKPVAEYKFKIIFTPHPQ